MNVNVKIPVTNTRREFAGPVIRELSEAGVTLNITAIQTLDQVRRVADALAPDAPAIVKPSPGKSSPPCPTARCRSRSSRTTSPR